VVKQISTEMVGVSNKKVLITRQPKHSQYAYLWVWPPLPPRPYLSVSCALC